MWAITAWNGEIVNAEPIEHDEIGWFTQAELAQLDLADPDVATACLQSLQMLETLEPM